MVFYACSAHADGSRLSDFSCVGLDGSSMIELESYTASFGETPNALPFTAAVADRVHGLMNGRIWLAASDTDEGVLRAAFGGRVGGAPHAVVASDVARWLAGLRTPCRPSLP